MSCLLDAVVDRQLRQRRRGERPRPVATSSETNIATHAPPVGRRAARPSPRSLRRRPRVLAHGPASAAGSRTAAACVTLTGRAAMPPRSGLRVRKTLVGQALLDDLAVQRRALEQLVVGAARGDRAVLEHDDLVGERDRREAVGDHERRAARHHLAQRELDLLLGRGVDRRGGVVEDQDPRVGEDRARDRDPLALAAGERQPALADTRVVALGQRAR